MATTNASSRVFSTWELCENILDFLPCKDLARARRVCLIFKNVVDQTSALQQSLFLQPRTSRWVWTLSCKSFFRSHKTDKLLAGPSMARHVKEAISEGEMVAKLTVFELHPALHVDRIHTSRSLGWLLGCCATENSMYSFYDAADIVFNRVNPVTDILRHSSMETMFLSQPPVLDIRFTVKCGCRSRLTSKCPCTHVSGLILSEMIHIHNDTGITFGELRDRIQLELLRYPIATFNCLMFDGGFAVTSKEKQAIEAAGALSWEHNSILCR